MGPMDGIDDNSYIASYSISEPRLPSSLMGNHAGLRSSSSPGPDRDRRWRRRTPEAFVVAQRIEHIERSDERPDGSDGVCCDISTTGSARSQNAFVVVGKLVEPLVVLHRRATTR